MSGTLIMSAKERKTLGILQQHLGGLLTIEEAAEELGISERQMYRIKNRFLEEGDAGLLHRARGRPSNFAYSAKVRSDVLAIYRRKYADYGATLFAERMEIHEGYVVDHETLRRWLLAAGLLPAVRRGRKHRKQRQRQPHIGSLVQLDGSDHDWFEGRGPRCTLLVFIDDASSTSFMRFASSENIREVLAATRLYIERYGVPALFYTDRGSAFYGTQKMPDFVRALKVLGSDVRYAGSPQAKGRVERANRTHQDRLVKIMRENNISSIEEANAFLDREYLEEHNARFAVRDGLEDIHRPVLHFDLDNIFCFEHPRQVKHDMTLQYRAKIIQILSADEHLPLPKQYVTVREWLDRSIHLFWRERELQWRYAPNQNAGQKPIEIGKVEATVHPWYNKPVGKLKRTRTTKL